MRQPGGLPSRLCVLAVVERLGEKRLATLDHRHFAMMRPAHVEALELLPAAPSDSVTPR